MLAEIDDSCPRVSTIRKYLREIIGMLASTDCPFPDDTKSGFIERLASVRIRCENCRDGLAGHTSVHRGIVTLCNGRITRRTTFHELVHAMGGRELDAEAMERHCFNLSSEPAGEDWDKFVRDSTPWGDLFAGDLVIWDPCTREIWVNAGTRKEPEKGARLKSLPRTPREIRKRYDIDCRRSKKKRQGKKTPRKPPSPAPEYGQ